MRSIAKIVGRLKHHWTEELSEDAIRQACRDAGMKWNNSILNPIITIQVFFLQVLHGNTAIEHLNHLSGISFTAAAYCKARMRIKLEVLSLLLKRCVDSLQQQALDAQRWLGHRVFFVDGSSFSMSDTPTLQKRFGQPGSQKPGCGFPTAHWLALMHAGTGMIAKMLASPLRTHDHSKVTEVHPELQANDILLADRAFCSFAHLCLLLERGVHALFRVHQATIVDFTPRRPHANSKSRRRRKKGLPTSRWIKQLGKNDQIVEWLRPSKKPQWMSDEQFASLPASIIVREVRFSVHQKGFRVKEITLVTTLLDPEQYSAESLAGLFRRRWEIETNLRHLKTTMKMDVLKCKSPEGVLRELHVFALIYNLVRQVMLDAAHRQNVDVRAISFIDALRWLQCAITGDPLFQITVNPHRPDRYEPRVKKRRPKPYALMNKPRRQLKQELLR